MKARLTKLSQSNSCVMLIILLCVFAIVLQSCSKTTSPKTGKLTGTISLIDDTPNAPLQQEIDYSGITVAIYQTTTLDTTITRINRDYPNLGVLINQETEFDHRLQSPVRVTTTNETGSFTLSNINKGKYNLVVFKEGWGVRYLYDVQISEGSNSLNVTDKGYTDADNGHKGNVNLYRERVLSGISLDPIEFLPHHTYRITDDATFTGSVTINPKTNILIAPTKKIAFYSNVNINSNVQGYVKITSAYGMYETTIKTVQEIEQFYDIECNSTVIFANNKLSSIVTTFSSIGWYIKVSGITIEDMVLRYNRVGMQVEQLSDITLKQCNFMNSTDVELGCVTVTTSSNITIQDVIAIKCTIALRLHTSNNTVITNSYFYKNSFIDIYNLYETICDITYCTFNDSNTAIDTSGRCNTIVKYCNITAKIGIYNHNQLNWHPTTFSANFNNFICSQYTVKTRSTFYNVTTPVYFNCENNYWGTSNTADIISKIWDRNDESPEHPEYNNLLGIVDYIPLKNSQIINIGVSS